MLADSLTQVVPGYISGKWKFQRLRDWAIRTANKIILNKRKRHMLEMIEMQAGRLRSDFIDRLNRSASRFRSRIIGNMDTVSQRNSPGNRKRHGPAPQGRRRSQPECNPVWLNGSRQWSE